LFGKYIKAVKAGFITCSAIIILQLVEHWLWHAYHRGLSGTIGVLSLMVFPLLVLVAGLGGAISVRLYEDELRKGEVNILAISTIPGLISGIASLGLGSLLNWAYALVFGSSYYVPSASICIVFTAPVSMTVLAVIGGLVYSYVYSESKDKTCRPD
jgi:hypothetical protein